MLPSDTKEPHTWIAGVELSLQALCFTLTLKFWQGRNPIWARPSRNTGQSPPVSKGCEIPQGERGFLGTTG